GRAFSYATTGVDMLVATMITYASGGYTSPFAVLFFLVITVSALRFGAAASVLCALLVAVLYLTAGAVAPLQNGTYLITISPERHSPGSRRDRDPRAESPPIEGAHRRRNGLDASPSPDWPRHYRSGRRPASRGSADPPSPRKIRRHRISQGPQGRRDPARVAH